jgi:hypothetical protein
MAFWEELHEWHFFMLQPKMKLALHATEYRPARPPPMRERKSARAKRLSASLNFTRIDSEGDRSRTDMGGICDWISA